jgi:hypothetical protein
MLEKGFLHQKIKLSRSTFILGIIIGLTFSLTFYSLAYLFRELLRLLSTTENYDVWLLSESEIKFYNLFYAFLSVTFGQSICFLFWLKQKRRALGRHRYLRSYIAIDQSVLNLSFLLWFLKIAFLFATFFGLDRSGGFYVFSFYPAYKYLFVLIIIVLFFNNWLTIRRIFKNRALKWMLISILCISGLSFLLSQINIVDYKAINKSLLENNIFEKYDLEVPTSDVYDNKLENRSLVNIIYLVKNPENENQQKATLIVENETINLDDLDLIVSAWRESCWDIDVPRMTYQLYIDKDLQMEAVNKLRLKLSSLAATRIAYAVLPNDRKYDKRYYRNYIFQARIPFTGTFGDLPPPPPPQVELSKYKNIIKIEVPEDNIFFINGAFIDKKNLTTILKQLLKESDNKIVQIWTDKKIRFSSYFIALSNYKKAIRELRNEYSINTFHLNFENLDIERKQQVKYIYPFALYEDVFYKK